MSHRILVSFFSLLLVCGMSSPAWAGTGKPHVKHHVKKIKKDKKHHHHHRGR
jgi:hypothetical protein